MSKLRDQMPLTSIFIDEMRKAFGTEMVDNQIRRAKKGEPTFYAEENGHVFGVQYTERGTVISGKDLMTQPKDETESKRAKRK